MIKYNFSPKLTVSEKEIFFMRKLLTEKVEEVCF
jgi:hypothetical protein